MIAEITPGVLRGQVRVPGSKSETHRALIAAALSQGESRISGACDCADTRATQEILTRLGARFANEEDTIVVQGGLMENGSGELDCGESGSTLRFMLPIALALGGSYRFTGAPRLFERPNEVLLQALSQPGVTITPSAEGIQVSGKLTPREFTVDGSVSSQYITGFLLAMPLLQGASLRVLGKRVSGAYVDITARYLKDFGVDAVEKNGAWQTQGAYTPCDVAVGGDWSAAAFWLAAGALGGIIRVDGVHRDSPQGDKAFAHIIKEMGAHVDALPKAARSTHGFLRGQNMDVSEIPDLVPILAVTACFAQGETNISGAARLRGKESDRLAATEDIITKLGGTARVMEDGLYIHGLPLRGGEFDSWVDHRIAMAGVIGASASTRPSIIHGVECVNKSYPDFFEHFKALGGKVVLRG